jgi:histidinol phosphatase-like PHP family hydrolase
MADEGAGIMLPPDIHVHSQWSWDALAGSMERTCLRAVELGLPSVAFTEHADLTAWTLRPGEEVPDDFEEEYRHVLRSLAAADKVLEVNTRVPLHPQVLAWWREEGGQAITFASDAHDPGALARGFGGAVHMAETSGFRPGRDPHAFWSRS